MAAVLGSAIREHGQADVRIQEDEECGLGDVAQSGLGQGAFLQDEEYQHHSEIFSETSCNLRQPRSPSRTRVLH